MKNYTTKAKEIISHLEDINAILISSIIFSVMDKNTLRVVMGTQKFMDSDVKEFMDKTQGDINKLKKMTTGQIMRNGDPTDKISDLISIRRDVAIVVDKSKNLLEIISKYNPTKEDIQNCVDKENLIRGKEAVCNAIDVLSKASDVDNLGDLYTIIKNAQKILDID